MEFIIYLFMAIIIAYFIFLTISANKKLKISRKKNEDLESENQKLKIETENIEKYINAMSNEIKTTLTAIISIASLGKENPKDRNNTDNFEKIIVAGDYLKNVVENTMDIVDFGKGSIEISERFVSCYEVFNSVYDLMQPIAQKKNIKINTEFNFEKSLLVKADKMKTKQIYINLLGNAIKFSEFGSEIQWKIEIEKTQDKTVKITNRVRDFGCGIREDQIDYIFESFSKENRGNNLDIPGAGLGLPLVKKILDRMNASILVQSKENEGSEFIVQSHHEAQYPSLEELTQKPRANDKFSFEGKRVLLAEDNEINATVATRLLSKKKIEVTWFNNGKLTLDDFLNSDIGYYDAIIMDIHMPIMNGIEATKAIRDSGRADSDKIPIIAMTTDVLPEDREKALEAGMNAHLTKPVHPMLMYETLEKCLLENK